MDPDSLSEGRGRREAPPSAEGSTGASPGKNALPAELIKGRPAFLLPRVATIGLLGATCFFAWQNEGLQGTYALMFPLFGSDASSRTQATYLMSNTMSPILIWSAEANRGGFTLEKSMLHTLAVAAIQISGIERIVPLCYLYSMAAWDWDSGNSSENCVVPSGEAKAVLPATLLGYVLPAALINLVPLTATGVSRPHFNIQRSVVIAFITAPPSVSVLTKLISDLTRHVQRKAGKEGPRGKATPEDKESCQTQEASDALHSLRLAYAVSFAIQATQHLYTIARNVIQAPRGRRSVVDVLGNLLTYPAFPGQKYSGIALYSVATLGFGLFTVWELRRRGWVSDRDATRSAAGVLAGQVLFGPGATYAGLWWWREGVLAKMRQRA